MGKEEKSIKDDCGDARGKEDKRREEST